MTAAIEIFTRINFPYTDPVIKPTSLSKNHMSVGPVIITIPTATINIIENLGIKTSVIFSRFAPSNCENVGNNVNTK